MRNFFQKALLRPLLRLAPWGVAIAILAWLFGKYPPSQILESITLANLWAFSLVVLCHFSLVWIIDTYGVAALLLRFTGKGEGRSLLAIRAATYPLSLLNYGAGQASLAYYIKRIRRIGTGEIIGLFTLITATDLVWVITLAFAGSFIGDHVIMGVNITPMVRTTGYIAYGAVGAHLLFWLLHEEDRVRGRLWGRFFVWLKSKSLFRIFHEATLRDYLRLALWRLPIHLSVIVSFGLAMLCFDGRAPVSAIIGNIPVSIMIGIIPISWSGVGTSNKALIDLLGPHLQAPAIDAGLVTAGELILAFSLLYMLSNFALKLIVGMAFLPRVQRASRKSKESVINQ